MTPTHHRLKSSKAGNLKAYIWCGVIALVISMMVVPLRGGYVSLWGITGFELSLLIGSVCFFALTLIVLQRTKSKKPSLILLATMVGVSTIELPVLLFNWESTYMSHLEFFSRYIVILSAYGCFKIKNIWIKVFVGIVCFSWVLWAVFWGYDLWANKVQFGSWTGRIEQIVTKTLVFQTPQGDSITVADYSGKYLVLDFWTTSCGVCWKKFPQVEALYQKYKNDERIVLYGVHCWNEIAKENYASGIQILRKKGYTFPVASVCLGDTAVWNIGVTAFPTVLIFSPQGTMVFRGTIENATQYIESIKVETPKQTP